MHWRRWWNFIVVMLIAAIGISGGAARGQSCRQWESRLPSPRYGAAAAFDSLRNVTVMYGGLSNPGWRAFAETWEWDGATWTLRADEGPGERYEHAMAFDSARGVVVMFGGRNFSSTLRDTWEWDGKTWLLRSLTGPAISAGHAMAYDPIRHVTVLCGPGGGTWEWNGQVWTLRAVGAPANRDQHAMVYDSVRDRMILFGGSTGGRETWEWAGAQGTWTLLTAPGPQARRGHAMTYDSTRGVAVLHGGLSPTGIYYDDTWEWDSRSAAWKQISTAPVQPAKRHEAVMVYDSARQESLLFGGRNPLRLADTWTLRSDDPKAWNAVSPYPTRVWDAPIAYDSRRKVTVGLFSPAITGPAETWEWDGIRWEQRSVTGPTCRAGSRMVYDSSRGRMVLFGGAANGSLGELGDTWEFDGTAWELVADTGPPARWYHAMAFDQQRGVTVLFGGTIDNLTGFGDTWEWDGKAWLQRLVAGPSARRLSGMSYDSARGVIVLFGGKNYTTQNVVYQDTWEWNGQSWTQRSLFMSVLLIQAAMTYDSRRGVSVVTGSTPGDPSGAPWAEWDGAQWHIYLSMATISGGDNSMTYDQARERVVMFGGFDNAQTWELGFASGCAADVNGDGHVDVNDLLAVLVHWGPCAQTPCVGDVNNDGFVNVNDLLIVIGGWGS